MYKVLIADDEELIRRGIASFIKKDSEFEIVGFAEDGEQALSLATMHLPDLLFVDINMPFLTGLEFIESLSKILKNAVIIVVTGYDDFTFIQKALQLGVSDYLLKPLSKKIFYLALDRAKERLAQNDKMIRYYEWAKLQMEKHRSLLVSNFLLNWLDGRLTEIEVAESLQFLNLDIPKHNLNLMIVHLTYVETLSKIDQGWEETLLYFAAENIASEILAQFHPLLCCKNTHGSLVLIFSAIQTEDYARTIDMLKEQLELRLPVHAILINKKVACYSQLPDVYLHMMDEADGLIHCSPLLIDSFDYIEKHFTDLDFSLQNMSEFLHVSPQHLSRVFKQESGETFIDYVSRARIRRAIKLLDDKELKVYQVAELAGYSNQHYFCNAFKKVLGVSPVEYRKQKGR